MMKYKLSNRLENGFHDIELLENNWNSHGAFVPSHKVIEKAKEFAMSFEEKDQPEIEPTPDGTIRLWWNENEIVFSLEIGEQDKF